MPTWANGKTCQNKSLVRRKSSLVLRYWKTIRCEFIAFFKTPSPLFTFVRNQSLLDFSIFHRLSEKREAVAIQINPGIHPGDSPGSPPISLDRERPNASVTQTAISCESDFKILRIVFQFRVVTFRVNSFSRNRIKSVVCRFDERVTTLHTSVSETCKIRKPASVSSGIFSAASGFFQER